MAGRREGAGHTDQNDALAFENLVARTRNSLAIFNRPEGCIGKLVANLDHRSTSKKAPEAGH
jgi:hypothetical protein